LGTGRLRVYRADAPSHAQVDGGARLTLTLAVAVAVALALALILTLALTLRSTGERVVVKVQNPEAERTFRGDVLP